MPIFADKDNERTAIRIIALFIFSILLFFGYQSGCNKRGLKIGNIELSSQEVLEKKEELNEKVSEFREQKKAINTISKNELPTILKDSIATLNYIREKDLNQGEELLTTFEKFNELSYNEQVSLIEKVLNYLSKKVYPNRYKDFGDIAKNIVTTNKMEILASDNKKKDLEIDGLEKEVAQLTKDKQQIETLYAQANKIIEQIKHDLEILRKDSVNNATLIADKQMQIVSLKEDKKKLKEEMDSYTLIRIKNCSFTSPGCRSKKDASYIVGCMKSLEVTFIVNYNNPSAIGKSETVKVVFMLPTEDPSKNLTKEKTVVANIGQETKVTFDEPNYKYIVGLYTAQIIHDKTSTTIPIEIKDLTAKKWLF